MYFMADLNKPDELDGTNYEVESTLKLNEVEILEAPTNMLMQPKEGNTMQHLHDVAAKEDQLRSMLYIHHYVEQHV